MARACYGLWAQGAGRAMDLDAITNAVRKLENPDALTEIIREANCRKEKLQRLAREARTDFSALELFSQNTGFREVLEKKLSPVDIMRLGACSTKMRAAWHHLTEPPPAVDMFCTTSQKDRQFMELEEKRGMVVKIPSGLVDVGACQPILNDSLRFLNVVFPLNASPIIKSVRNISGQSGAFLMQLRIRSSTVDSLLLFAPIRRPGVYAPSIWRDNSRGPDVSSTDKGPDVLTHGVGYVDPLNSAYFYDPNRVLMETLQPAVSPSGKIYPFRGVFCDEGSIENDSNYRESSFYCPMSLRFEISKEVKHAYPLLVPGITFGQTILGGEADFFAKEMRDIFYSGGTIRVAGGKRVIFTNSLLIPPHQDIGLHEFDGATVFKRNRLYWITDFKSFNFPLPSMPLTFASDFGSESLCFDNNTGFLLAIGGVNRLSGRKRSEVFGLNLRGICSQIQNAHGGRNSSINQYLQAIWCDKIQHAIKNNNFCERRVRQVYENGPCCVGPSWEFLGLLKEPRSDAMTIVCSAGAGGGFASNLFVVGGKGKSTIHTRVFECLYLYFESPGKMLKVSTVNSKSNTPKIPPWAACECWCG